MRKILILLICFLLILGGCTPQADSLPKGTSQAGKTDDGGFWKSTETAKNTPAEPSIISQPPQTGESVNSLQPPKGGYWRFVRVECDEFKPINDAEHGISWSGQILSNSIQATYIGTDNTNVNYPVEQKFVYNWSWKIDPLPGSDSGNLYPGDKVEILLSLEYTGIDLAKLGNFAEIYTGAFKNYPPDNRLIFNGPGGVGSKPVSISIPKGFPGGQSTIDIVCSGSTPQSFKCYYIYEWVE